jgi:DNA-binding transcriptional MerR regulator
LTPKKKNNNGITARELAAVTDETYHTIDHWTDKGLLPNKRRGSKRYYDPSESKERCKEIRRLQEQGLTLPQILKELSRNDQ